MSKSFPPRGSARGAKAVLTLIAVFLLPFVPLLYLYQKNMTFLFFNQVLLVGLVFGLLSVTVYGLAGKIFGCRLSGVLIAIAFTIGLFLADAWLFAANQLGLWAGVSKYAGYGVMALVTVALVWLLGFLGKKLPGESMPGFYVLVGVMLLLNAYNVLAVAVSHSNDPTYQSDYRVEAEAKEGTSPNIYWFFTDCMMSPKSMEKYYPGFSGDELRKALQERDFVLAEDATLETDWYTVVAVPTLFSPYYYDNTLVPMYEQGMSPRTFVNKNWKSAIYINRNNETFDAFQAAGYTTVKLSLNMRRYFFYSGDPFYAISDHYFPTVYPNGEQYIEGKPFKIINDQATLERDSAETLAKLIDAHAGTLILKKLWPSGGGIDTEPLSVRMPDEEVKALLLCDDQSTLNEKEMMLRYYSPLAHSFYDSLETVGGPKLTVMHLMLGHYPWPFTLAGNLANPNISDDENYPAQYEIAWRVYLNMADMILARDPDAIIVIQSDHGDANGIVRQKYTDEATQDEMHNSVLSALRIPEKWADPVPYDLLSDPRNISRWLINTFVGQNYSYIQ